MNVLSASLTLILLALAPFSGGVSLYSGKMAAGSSNVPPSILLHGQYYINNMTSSILNHPCSYNFNGKKLYVPRLQHIGSDWVIRPSLSQSL